MAAERKIQKRSILWGKQDRKGDWGKKAQGKNEQSSLSILSRPNSFLKAVTKNNFSHYSTLRDYLLVKIVARALKHPLATSFVLVWHLSMTQFNRAGVLLLFSSKRTRVSRPRRWIYKQTDKEITKEKEQVNKQANSYLRDSEGDKGSYEEGVHCKY